MYEVENGRYYAGKRKRACLSRISVRAIRTASDKGMREAFSFFMLEPPSGKATESRCAAQSRRTENASDRERQGEEKMKMLKNWPAFVMAMLFAAPLYASCGYGDAFDEATAQIWEDPATGYRWYYKSSGDAVRIEQNWEWSAPTRPKPTGNFSIPSQIDGLPVVGIGRDAFQSCQDLTSLTVPNSVTNIYDFAFAHCRDLTRITLSDNLVNIGNGAFYGCVGLSSISIPNTVKYIGGYVFEGCNGLTRLTIPSSVVRIGGDLVKDCSGLKSLVFQGSEVELEDYLFNFRGCASLESYTLPSKITGDSDYLGLDFSGCLTLGDITIPSNIQFAAFSGCSNLVSVSFPESFVSFGCYSGDGDWRDESFSNCDNLKRATFNGKPPLGFVSTLSDEESVWVRDGSQGFLSLCLHADSIYYPAKYESEWKKVLRNIGYGGVSGVIGSEGTTATTGGDARYDLSDTVKDRAITSVTIDSDTAIDSFVLTDGKVFDSVLRIVNTSDNDVRVSLPNGYEYETIKGANPLTIPANSRNILTITRTASNVFLVSRRELETVQ